jgi:hypothetical protein
MGGESEPDISIWPGPPICCDRLSSCSLMPNVPRWSVSVPSPWPPPTVARHEDLRRLVAALDRSADIPDLRSVAATLRILIGHLDAGEVKDQGAVRQRLTGALIAVELLSAGDDAGVVATRLMTTGQVVLPPGWQPSGGARAGLTFRSAARESRGPQGWGIR